MKDSLPTLRLVPASLCQTIRQNEMETMLKNARLTANAAATADRAAEASRQVHLAMYRFALGQITEQERQQILAILQPCCPTIFFQSDMGGHAAPLQ